MECKRNYTVPHTPRAIFGLVDGEAVVRSSTIAVAGWERRASSDGAPSESCHRYTYPLPHDTNLSLPSFSTFCIEPFAVTDRKLKKHEGLKGAAVGTCAKPNISSTQSVRSEWV